MKKIMISILIVTIFVSQLSMSVLASEVNILETINTEDQLEESIEYFEALSIEELNDYITKIKTEIEIPKQGISRDIKDDSIIALKVAWIAAAEIAKKQGYPCAAKLVKNSVLYKDYYETDGMFSEKIVKTKAYKEWISDGSRKDSIRFKKSDDSDLFYAIHKADIRLRGSSYAANVKLTDVFDFELELDKYDSLFTTTVNNWAWLCQNTFVLSPIDVEVKFDI